MKSGEKIFRALPERAVFVFISPNGPTRIDVKSPLPSHQDPSASQTRNVDVDERDQYIVPHLLQGSTACQCHA